MKITPQDISSSLPGQLHLTQFWTYLANIKIMRLIFDRKRRCQFYQYLWNL